MSETKFTPGPWGAVTNDGHIKHAVIYVNGGGFDISNAPDAVANAHLISAAPEMYEELQEVSNWLNSQLGMGEWHKDIEKLLSKARGETS